jgi:hypothetical protein
VITLEYGEGHDRIDPFDVTASRKSQQDTSGLDGRYLHPVVRWYRDGEFVADHHLTENLENEWDSEEFHRAPLRAFLTAQRGAVTPAGDAVPAGVPGTATPSAPAPSAPAPVAP